MGGVFLPTDDRAGVAHPAARRRGRSGDESGDGLLTMVLGPACGVDLGVAADFTDHDDRFGLGVVVEHLQHFEMVGAVDRISADADTGALAVAELGELEHSFVSESARAGNHADVAALVDVARSDADAAAAVRFLAAAGSDEAGAVRPDEPGLGAAERFLDAHHVHDGNAFGDADDELHAGVGGFEDGIGGEGWRHENRGGGGSGFVHGLGDGVEDRHDVLKHLSSLAGSDTGDKLGAISK